MLSKYLVGVIVIQPNFSFNFVRVTIKCHSIYLNKSDRNIRMNGRKTLERKTWVPKILVWRNSRVGYT